MLDDLDLSGNDGVMGSRPIGGEGKYRTTSSVTLISSAAIAELVDEDGGRGKHPDMLREMGVALKPGNNTIRLSGKVLYSKIMYNYQVWFTIIMMLELV